VIPKTRVCWRCKNRRRLRQFSRDKNRVSGRKYGCKKCCSALSVIYRRDNRVKISADSLRRYHINHKRALEIVGRGALVCRDCGCDTIELLEINHIRGGGRKEFDKRGNSAFYRDIVAKRRKIVDLNILCKVCNIVHYLKVKHGKLPYKISFDSKSII